MPRSPMNAETVEGSKSDEGASPTTFTKFPKMMKGNMDRCLFLGKQVEAWRVAVTTHLKENGFYLYDNKKHKKPRKECVGSHCKRYREANGTVFCSEYCAGWCSYGLDEYGKPYDKKLIEVETVLAALDP